MKLYHGSEKEVKVPLFGYGKVNNDYGQGFYMAENIELAKEWSANEDADGYVNEYELDISELKVLNLNDKKYNILNWLALLVKNREFDSTSEMMSEAKKYLLKNFLLNTEEYDVIIGYRADDSYFSFARDFLSNVISLEKLNEAMRLGKLGIQIFLKSKKAFEKIRFIKSEVVNHNIYYSKRINRDIKARRDYVSSKSSVTKGLYILNILQEEMRQDDGRLFL